MSRAGTSFTRGTDRNTWTDAGGTTRSTYNFGVDYDYVEVLGMKIVEGRNFSRDFPSDPSGSVLVNQAFVREFDLDQPIGYKMEGWLTWIEPVPLTVIGVVKDFNFQSLRQKVVPAVLNMHPKYYNYMGALLIKIRPTDISSSIKRIENAWKQVLPEKSFGYSFLDEDVANQYQTEQRWESLLSYSSFLALLIACLGLFALALLTVGRRTREIGIRKVLGSSVSGVIILISGEFGLLVLVASVLAVPLTWYTMNAWLNGFDYRIAISPLVFLGAGAAALVLSLATVALHSFRAALSNPVEALRYE
jgi:putative ABC transport system permease protein